MPNIIAVKGSESKAPVGLFDLGKFCAFVLYRTKKETGIRWEPTGITEHGHQVVILSTEDRGTAIALMELIEHRLKGNHIKK